MNASNSMNIISCLVHIFGLLFLEDENNDETKDGRNERRSETDVFRVSLDKQDERVGGISKGVPLYFTEMHQLKLDTHRSSMVNSRNWTRSWLILQPWMSFERTLCLARYLPTRTRLLKRLPRVVWQMSCGSLPRMPRTLRMSSRWEISHGIF